VATKGLARREAQPTRATRVRHHSLRLRRGSPEVAGPVAAQRLERCELPPARRANERLPSPLPATACSWWRAACCFCGGRGGGGAAG